MSVQQGVGGAKLGQDVVIGHKGIGSFVQKAVAVGGRLLDKRRSEEHTSELQSLMRISYAVFCLKKKKKTNTTNSNEPNYNTEHISHKNRSTTIHKTKTNQSYR